MEEPRTYGTHCSYPRCHSKPDWSVIFTSGMKAHYCEPHVKIYPPDVIVDKYPFGEDQEKKETQK